MIGPASGPAHPRPASSFRVHSSAETSHLSLSSNTVMMLNGVQSSRGDEHGRALEDLAREAAAWALGRAASREGTAAAHVGTKERQERERTALRRSILDAARELFVAEGFDKISMRKIADRIEYSPAAIYSYFPSKDDIFFALADEGFGILCHKAWPDPDEQGSLAALRSTLLRFVEFSQEQPEYFALMFLDRTVPRIRDHYHRFPLLIEAKRRLTLLVRESIERGELPQDLELHQVTRLCMTAAHGAAVAAACGRMGPGEDACALAEDAINLVIAGLRTRTVTLTFRPSPDPPISCVGSADTLATELSREEPSPRDDD
jgi:AcrR family transcriptional regulator